MLTQIPNDTRVAAYMLTYARAINIEVACIAQSTVFTNSSASRVTCSEPWFRFLDCHMASLRVVVSAGVRKATAVREEKKETALPTGQHCAHRNDGEPPHLPGRFSGLGCLSGLFPALLTKHRTCRFFLEDGTVHNPRLNREGNGFSLEAASVPGVNFIITAMSAKSACWASALCLLPVPSALCGCKWYGGRAEGRGESRVKPK